MRRLAFVSVLLLAGCGRKEGGGGEAAAPPKDQVTIVFRHGSIPGFERYLNYIFQQFTRENPGIAIQSESLPNNVDQQHQIYSINLEGKTEAFDLMGMDIIWVAEFARAGWLLDLTPYFTQDQRSEFLPSTIQAATYRGGVYAVPWFTDSGLLYYRSDLLEKYGHRVPQTWPELAMQAKDILAKENDPRLTGFLWQGKQYEGMVCDAVEFLGSNGVRFLDEKGRWAVRPDKAIPALQFMTDLLKVPDGPSPLLVLAGDEETTRQIFGNGEAVFMRNWPYAYGIFNKPDSPVRGKFGIAPLPHFADGPSVGTLGGWFYGINKRSRHPKEAFKFIQYMTSPAVQKDLFIKLAYLPTRSALYRDPELTSEYPQMTQFAEILKRTQPRPVTPFYSGVSEILQSEFSGVLAGIKTPEEALRNISIQVEPILGLAPEARLKAK